MTEDIITTNDGEEIEAAEEETISTGYAPSEAPEPITTAPVQDIPEVLAADSFENVKLLQDLMSMTIDDSLSDASKALLAKMQGYASKVLEEMIG